MNFYKPQYAFVVCFAVLMASCKEKKKEDATAEPGSKVFPALSFIRSQVAMIDTSLYSIKGYITRDSSHTDTLYIPRESFKAIAADFLELPDISTDKYSDAYKEENSYDESINRVMLITTPAKPEKQLIQQQEVLIQPDPATGDKVTSIFIKTFLNTKDSSVQKMLLWKADKSFQVTTIRQLPGQPETTTVKRVVWNEEDEQ